MSRIHIAQELESFYALLAALPVVRGQGRPLGELVGRESAPGAPWPRRGVYFVFEPGEVRTGSGSGPRVVRVGTHAVGSGTKSTLWGRLRTHRGTGAGHGNHRGSIFRLHVGMAQMARDGVAFDRWGVGASAPRDVRTREAEREAAVSRALGAMSVRWVAVDDEPGPTSERALLERAAIAILASATRIDPPSEMWLGRQSPRREIRESGLWNLQHLDAQRVPTFLEVLERRIAETVG